MPSRGPRLIAFSIDQQDRSRGLSAIAALGLLLNVALVVRGVPGETLPNLLHRNGITDPLCGGTRAARLTLMGDWSAAWNYNPVGIAASLAAVLYTARTAWGVVSGSWLNVRVTWTRLRRTVFVCVLVLAFGLLGVRQQLRSDFLLEKASGIHVFPVAHAPGLQAGLPAALPIPSSAAAPLMGG